MHAFQFSTFCQFPTPATDTALLSLVGRRNGQSRKRDPKKSYNDITAFIHYTHARGVISRASHGGGPDEYTLLRRENITKSRTPSPVC